MSFYPGHGLDYVVAQYMAQQARPRRLVLRTAVVQAQLTWAMLGILLLTYEALQLVLR